MGVAAIRPALLSFVDDGEGVGGLQSDAMVLGIACLGTAGTRGSSAGIARFAFGPRLRHTWGRAMNRLHAALQLGLDRRRPGRRSRDGLAPGTCHVATK